MKQYLDLCRHILENGQIKKPNTILVALYEWIFDYSEIIFVVLTTTFLYFL